MDRIWFLDVALMMSLMCGVPATSRAQVTFERTFGGSLTDRGNSVKQTLDGGYIIVGETSSYGAGAADVYLVKTDGNGDVEWSRTFGGTLADIGNSVQQTSDGGYIITGYTYSFGVTGGDDGSGLSNPVSSHTSDIFLIKTDGSGAMEWSQVYGGDEGYSVEKTMDGGYIVIGTITCVYLPCVYLIKTNGSGTPEWTRTVSEGDITHCYSGQQTLDGGYILAGEVIYDKHDPRPDVLLIKTNGNGYEEWSRTFGTSGGDVGHSVQQTLDGGFIIAGDVYISGFPDYNVYLVKTDEYGNLQWSRSFGGSWGNFRVDHGYSVRQTEEGGYIIAGDTNSFSHGDYNVYLVKTNRYGMVLEPDIDRGVDLYSIFR